MLNLSFVKTFVTLVETGSYVETGKFLGLSQPTVSQQIRKLEITLGSTLIHRSNSACTPTRHGRAVLPYARALLKSAEKFEMAAEGNHVCIGCSGNIATYYIASSIKNFVDTETTPISWDIRAAANSDITDLLENGEIDLAATEWVDPRPGTITKPWRREPLVVVVSPSHPLASEKSISLKTLLKLELIRGERGSGTGALLRKVIGPNAKNLKIIRNLHSTEAVKNAVRADLGSSIMLEGAVYDEVKSGQLVSLTIEGIKLEKTFHLAHPAELPKEALPSRLVNFLTQEEQYEK
jgi:DNA-binding transcriptional LysR family regulator